MWSFYAAFCLERLKRKTNVEELKEKVSEYTQEPMTKASVFLEVDVYVCVCVTQRQQRLLGVLQRAHDSLLLKEDYYKNWVR